MGNQDLALPIFILLGMFIFLGFLLRAQLLRLLRRDHHDVWVELGSPSLFLNNSMRNSWMCTKWVLGGHYKKLGDPKVTAVASTERIVTLVYWTSLATAVVIVLTSILVRVR